MNWLSENHYISWVRICFIYVLYLLQCEFVYGKVEPKAAQMGENGKMCCSCEVG